VRVRVCMCVCVCVCLCVYLCVHTLTHTHTRTHAHTHTRTHAHTHTTNHAPFRAHGHGFASQIGCLIFIGHSPHILQKKAPNLRVLDVCDLHRIHTYVCTRWRRPIGCLKSQVIFRKRATECGALLRKMYVCCM